MNGQEFEYRKDLITWMKASLEAIPNRVLEQVFEEWISRVQGYIDHEGFYSSE
jgi:hypothetical protein